MKKGKTALAVLAVVVTCLSCASPSWAFEVKRTPKGALVHWEEDALTWSLDPTLEAVSGARPAISKAVAAWSGRKGAPRMATDDAESAAEPGLDGKSTVFFFQRGYELAGRALAITILSYDENTGAILDADVVVNGRYRFDVGADDDPAAYDLERILAHEVGHGLGLSDEFGRAEALMYPYVKTAAGARIVPGKDDLDGLSSLYGAKKADASQEAGCGGATVARVSALPAPLWLVAMALFGCAMVALARRGHRRACGIAMGLSASVLVAPPTLSSTTHDSRAAGTSLDGRGRDRLIDALGPSDHDASEPGGSVATGDAEALVGSVRTTVIRGLFRSEVTLETVSCRARTCPRSSTFTSYGGVLGGVRQEVGGGFVPRRGERVAVGFESVSGLRRLAALLPTAEGPVVTSLGPRARDGKGLRP